MVFLGHALDHLVLYLPLDPSTNLPSCPDYLEENFTLSPGGFHADGTTSNTLILLADGCYIELISFVNRSAAPAHWWGPDASFVGWKDWCLTNDKTPEVNYESIKSTHGQPIPGGRRRADGVQVKWAVTFPKGEHGGQSVRGRLPFFCHDTTTRNTRVPINDDVITHASGALGVIQLTIIVKDNDMLEQTKREYTSVLGEYSTGKGDEVLFHVGQVHKVDGLDGGPKILLRLPKDAEEFEKVKATGFLYGNVILGAKSRPGQPAGSLVRLDAELRGSGVGGLWIEYA